MFGEILFNYDEKGNPLTRDGRFDYVPRRITKEDCAAKCFIISSGESNTVTVERIPLQMTNPADDPWFDQFPITKMLRLHHACCYFSYGGVMIVGFEYPGLCQAGILKRPEEGCKAIPRAPYGDIETLELPLAMMSGPHGIGPLKPQLINLIPVTPSEMYI